ncbi:MAG: hypothetical protein JWO96_159 [Candidatus Saccharibacteria bacterium]|nr:hypothetical protein [Candidatus Saccharibacteria bacterium]
MLGIRNTKRFAVLSALLCLVVASVTASAQAGHFKSSDVTTVTSANGHLLFNGVPRIPIMAAVGGCPDAASVDSNVFLGVAVLEGSVNACGGPAGPSARLHEMLSGKVLWRQTRPSSESNFPELLNWQASADVYYSPFLVGCSAHTAAPMFDAIQKLVGAQPVVSQIILRDELGPGQKNCLTPSGLGVLFWTSIVGGAAGIEYSTDLPWNDTKGFSVNAALLPQAKKQAGQLTTLQPAILAGRRLPVTTASSLVKATAWLYKGAAYLVAVNTSDQPTAVNLSFRGMKISSAKLMWEKQKVKVVRGIIPAHFTSLATHIYKLVVIKKK